MIGLRDFERYAETSGDIAGGDWEAQLLAWGVDHDELMAFTRAYGRRMAGVMIVGQAGPVESHMLSFLAGFEMGYRACLDQDVSVGELDASGIIVCSDCGRASDDLIRVPHDSGDAYYCPDCRHG